MSQALQNPNVQIRAEDKDVRVKNKLIQEARHLLSGVAETAGVSPANDPYARRSFELPISTEVYQSGVRNHDFLSVRNTIANTVKEILASHLPGATFETAILHGERTDDPIELHLFLYGDKNTPTIATIDGLGRELTSRRESILADFDRAFDVSTGRQIK